MAKRNEKSGPQFVSYFPAVLEALRELGGSGRPAEVRDRVATLEKVPENIQEELLSSGQPRFDNQVAWARFYLVRGGFLDSSRRGVWTLTDKGRQARLTHDQSLKVFREIHSLLSSATSSEPVATETEEVLAPEDEAAVLADHRTHLLATLQSLPASGFEQFCRRLLRESGFQDVEVTGRSGDGGIDGIGILQVNPLVSFKVLFQCKRYQGSVTPSQVRDFRGAMQGRADKGIIITTGVFTQDARREAVRDGVPPIELVDGEKLVGMLEDLELGLKPVRAYRVDIEFFKEFKGSAEAAG
ncbi:MAG TPA: restriction endonuclease [Thermoanaerobaculia bacterium]|jgi:restriction system protein